MSRKLIWMLFPLLLLILESVAFEPPPERDIFTVAILGDRTGASSSPEGLEVIGRAVYEINQLNPDFVMHVGDMVQGYTRDKERWLKEYEEFMSYMNELNVPWYPVAGNHDVFTAIWDPNDRTFEELYKEHFGQLYYSFDYRNSHFVVMYTDEAMVSKPAISSDQMAWLKKDLEGTSKTNIFIFMHKPVWRYDSNWNEIHQIIKGYPVRAVVAGHFHAYQKDMNKDGIQYYIMGVTGGEAHLSEYELIGWFDHYNVLRVEGDKFVMAVVKMGNVEADDYVLTEDYEKIWTIGELAEEMTGSSGWLWQPTREAVEGEVEVFAYNPLDVDIPVEVRLNPDRGPWFMEPSSLDFSITPKSNATARVKLFSPRSSPEDFFPPEFEFEYVYTDSHEREVPVTLRRRVLLRDIHEVYKCKSIVQIDAQATEPFWQHIAPLYNHTWLYSVYERPDDPPMVYLAADGENLYFYAEVMDDDYSYLKENRSRGILSDSIVFSTQPSGNRQEVVIFPFNKGGNAFTGKVDERGWLRPSDLTAVSGVEYYTKTDQNAGYYYCEGKVPLSLLFGGEPVAGKDVPFNVGIIDNDQEAFIYVRSWAFDRDPQYWGILKFTEN